ncbi:hypothetical protein SCA6_014033 [Theobroma cacao]
MHRKHFFDRPKSKTSIYDDLSSASLPSLMMKDGIDHGKDQSCEDRPTSSQTAANMMERLPQEIILGILSRLLIASLVQSNFTLTDFSNHSQGNVNSKRPPNSSVPMCLVDSCNGLLCMRDSRGIYICNPFTRLFIELSEFIKSPAQLGHLEFGFHPTTKEYKVVQTVYRKSLGNRDGSNVDASTIIQSEFHILTIGSPGWRNLGKITYRFIWQTSKVMVKGRLHWLSRPNKYSQASLLISFDLATEQFQEMPKPDCCGLGRCFHHLMVLRGCLSAGAYHDKQLEVWIMKEYGMKESWVKEFNIGTYLPQTLQQENFRCLKYSRVGFPNSFVRVVCNLKSDEILLDYKSRAFVLYDPQQGTFKELTLPEIPDHFKIVAHVGSLNWLDTPINI